MITKTKLSLVLTLIGLSVAAGSWMSSGQPLANAASQMADMNMTAKQPSQMSSTPANANDIIIQNFSFQPATLTVKAGTKVTWVNRDDDPHTATATDKQFNSKTLDTGDQFSMQFTKPGTYNYYCALHPKMTGQVIVN
jgi:plastocyanin